MAKPTSKANQRFTLTVKDEKTQLYVTISTDRLKDFTDPNAISALLKDKQNRTMVDIAVNKLNETVAAFEPY